MSVAETKMAEAATKENDRAFDAFSFLARFAPLIFLLLLMAIFAIMEPRFLSSINLFNVMRQVSITGLLAIGMTFVILTAGIDLSVGSLLAFAGLVAAAVAKGGMQDRFTVGDAAIGYGWPLAALSASCWSACGYPRSRYHELKVPPSSPLGMSVFRGAALLLQRRTDLRLWPEFTWWGQGRILTVPVPVIIFLVSALMPTSFTRAMAAGFDGGLEAARLAASRQPDHLQRLRLMGFFAGLGSFVWPRLTSVEAAAGTNMNSPSLLP
jgi:ribose/xylose/arabinose/galactoside ABC-type transport system permease subunit